MGVSSPNSPSIDGIECHDAGFQPVRGAAQEVAHTASRRSGPRRWLRAVAWLIAAGLHPKANATTLRVAEDLAGRMDYDTGHARYLLDEMVARLGIDRSTIKRHIAMLRELGALAWVQHGTRANIRRALGLGGYAGTATVYAAVIPAVYDHAMGHRIVGSGYTARIVVDQRGQAQTPVDNPPVDNQGPKRCAPPSRTWVKEDGQVQMVGGSNYTPRAGRRTTSIPQQKTHSSSNSRGSAGRRSPMQVAQDIRIARQVRPLVNWTQAEGLRRLAYALRPLIDRGLDAMQIADELAGMCLGWRPRQPANYLRTVLAKDAAQLEAQAAADALLAAQTWTTADEDDVDALARLFGVATGEPAPEPRTDHDRYLARRDWSVWPEVAAHYADDPDDALDLYGEDLVTYAVRMDAHTQDREARLA
ncbi:cell wall protein [Streptomyces lavendulocolor]|uniref:cell wall protein n=1 Tax=Streptomyces lavendulocolor TaxID=67316 RepID=UPI003C2AF403